MKVLITGCNGAVGSYMMARLHGVPDISLHGLGRSVAVQPFDVADDDTREFRIDLCDDEAILSLFNEERYDLILHFASETNVAASFETPSRVLRNNVISTSNLFEAAHRYCPDATIVLASTSEIYGLCPDGIPIDETASVTPANPYAVSKAAGDLLASALFQAWGLRVIRIRAFSYFNPRRTNLFSSAFARQIAEIEIGKQSVLRHGNLDSRRSFVDVLDVCEAYWLARICEPGEAYNVGSETSYTIGEILERMIALARVPIKMELDNALLRPTDVIAQVPVCRKFRDATGWRPWISLDESLRRLLMHWRLVVAKEVEGGK